MTSSMDTFNFSLAGATAFASGYVGTSGTGGVVVRATTYSPQGANAQRSVKSSSANDTGAGTGAQQVTINYLNTAFQLKKEVVILNGLVAVNTVNTDIAYIESMVVSQVGSVGGNVGMISLFTSTLGTGSVWGSIAASDNQTFWAHHYVPTGVNCYITGVSASSTAAAGSISLQRTGNPSSTNLPQLPATGTYVHAGPGTVNYQVVSPILITGPDFIFALERPTSATVSTTFASFEYLNA